MRGLRPHVFAVDTRDRHRFFHGVAAERLAEFLVEQHLDERRDPLGLIGARGAQRFGKLAGGRTITPRCPQPSATRAKFTLGSSSVPMKLLLYQRIELRFSAPHW